MINNPKILIIPDIHGRKFWKSAIQSFPHDLYPELQIIFLGDYLDPYVDYDGISKEEAFDNFEDIIDYAKRDNRIRLLIGNHDWHYFVNCDNCRIDRARAKDIENIFKENMNMFSLLEIVDINEIKYIFSHAGITSGWINSIIYMAKYEIENWKTTEEFPIKEEDPRYIWISEISKLNETNNYEILNECLKNYSDNFYSCIPSMISSERGGYFAYGSLIWADVHEHLWASEDLQGFYQIFGHTYSFPNGTANFAISINDKPWAMLDCGKAFILDSIGNIEQI